MEKHTGNRNLIVIAVVVCVLVVSIGYSFAFFMTGVTTRGSGGTTTGTTKKMIQVTYDAGSAALALTNAYPGASTNKDFKVTVNPNGSGQTSATYKIYLNLTSNGFSGNNIKYTLTDKSDSTKTTSGYLNSTGKVLLGTFTKNATASTDFAYNLKLEFVYSSTVDQTTTGANKSLAGNVTVELG